MTAAKRPPPGWWLLVIGFPLLTLILVVGGFLVAAQGGFSAFQVPREDATTVSTDPDVIERGRYLARIGDCGGCHSVRGGEPLAGGRGFATDWGVVYSTNLTPDPATGIGAWSPAEFRHTLQQGVSRTGLLYPAFPFQHFQHLEAADVDAIFAWLRSQPAVVAPTPPNTLEGFAGWRPILLGWRMLFHRPQPLPPAPERGPAWLRGRYLVEGLGHCAMCHGHRGAYGSQPLPLRFAGGRIPRQGWVAPALDRDALAHWTVADLAEYLRTGMAPQSSAFGPMAEVVRSSTQYLTPADAEAMAQYLLELPPVRIAPAYRDYPPQRARSQIDVTTAALYEKHCGDCHGDDGRGQAPFYPPLAGNPQVTASDPVNLIRVTLIGAAAPTTAGNPQPHSMPPFVNRLADADLLAILNHVRGSWGNDATLISRRQLEEVRAMQVE